MKPEGSVDLKPMPSASPRPLGSTVAIAIVLAIVFVSGFARFADKPNLIAKAGDSVSGEEAARRMALLSALSPVKVRRVSASEREAAIGTMDLQPQERASLRSDLVNDRISLIWISFYDSDAEDQDVIAVSSGGLLRAVPLLKKPVTVALPAPIDGQIKITGSIDGGGGGVTVGIVTPAGPAPLAILSVGQTISIPVAVQ